MTPEVQAALIALAGTMFASFMAYMTLKLRTIGKVADKTHTLVNSNMGIQLRLNAGNSQIVAELRGRPEDIQAAKLAEKMLADHEGKQATVDAGRAS